MAFIDQVQDLTSLTVSDTGELSQFLNDGVIDVTTRWLAVRPQDIDNFTRESAEQTSNGFNPGTNKIISVIRENGTDGQWYPCNPQPISLQYLVTDKTSLHYASKYNPVYMVTQNRNVHVYPAPSGAGNDGFKVLYVNSAPEETDGTALDHNSTGIKWFPQDKVYLVIMYAGIKLIQANLGNKTVPTDPVLLDVPVLNITATDPTGISLSTVTYTGISDVDTGSVSDVTHTTVDITGATQPAYTAPTQTISGVNWATEYPSQASAIATALTAINTELDETQAVCDNIATELGLSKAEVVLAKAEAAELATNTDNSSDFATALTAINTELDKVDDIIVEASTEIDKVDNVIGEASVEFDKSTALLDLGETDSETAVNAAVAKMVTELDETQTVCDAINTQVDSAVTELAKAVTEAGEMITQTDNSGDIETALDAINTAVDKFRADNDDPALFGDQTQYETGIGMTHVKDALDNARTIIDDGASSPTGDALGDAATYLFADEDTELLQGALGIAGTEIQRAQAHIQEWTTVVQTLQAEINGFAAEVQSRAAFTGAKGQTVQAIVAEAQGYLQAAQGFGTEVQSKINISNGYAAEITIRLQQAQAKREESKSRLLAGDAYLKEAQAIIAQSTTYIAESQAYIAQAQGYANEVSARGAFSSAKFQAIQGYINTAKGYTATAEGYSAELQNKIAIGQGYASEVEARLAPTALKIQEYQAKVQDALNTFNEQNAEYQAEVTAEIKQADINNQENLQNMQKALQIAIRDKDRSQEHQMQEAIQDMQAIIASNQDKIAQYQAEAQHYATQVNEDVQKYTAEIQAYSADAQAAVSQYQAELQGKQVDYQWLENRYAQLKAEYDAAFGLVAQTQQEAKA